MHRFFADERGIVQDAAYLNAEDAGHALRVLRLESGDEVELVCAPARYRAKIDSTEGGEVRLRYAYLIRCDEVIRDAEGRVTELRCTYDPESAGGKSSDGRRVKGVIHWVSAAHAVRAEVRLFDRLFTRASLDDLEEGKTFLDYLNPESLRKVTGYLEPSLAEASVGDKFQFERTGYFCMDRDSAPGRPVFNRTVTLKDSWAKIADK